VTIKAYLDSEGVVLCIGKRDHTIEEIQSKQPTVVTKIAEAPEGLIPKGSKPTYHTLVSGDGTSIEDYEVNESPLHLESLRVARYDSMDMVTGSVLAQGFTHNGIRFSLSIYAQTNWSEMWRQRHGTLFEYPVEISTLEEGITYLLADAEEVDTFYRAGYTKVREELIKGRALKKLVKEANTAASINGVVDSRIA